jgi:hypothetical protein
MKGSALLPDARNQQPKIAQIDDVRHAAHAKAKYLAGTDPLNMCGAHQKGIIDLVKELKAVEEHAEQQPPSQVSSNAPALAQPQSAGPIAPSRN